LPKKHYLLSFAGFNTGFLVNLDTLAWARTSNPCLSFWDSCIDPTDATGQTVWAIRWYDTTSPVSQVAGQFVNFSSLLSPTTQLGGGGFPVTADADTTTIQGAVQTKFYSETDQETLKNFRRVQVEYSDKGDGALAVARSVLPTELNTFSALVTLPSSVVSGQRSVSGIYSTVKSIGVAYRFVDSHYFELYAIKHSFSPTRVGRSQ
jgi:hypothetical protein